MHTGQIHATPDFLATVPRHELVEAIKRHIAAPAQDGQPVMTEHCWQGVRFIVETNAERTETRARLEGEC